MFWKFVQYNTHWSVLETLESVVEYRQKQTSVDESKDECRRM